MTNRPAPGSGTLGDRDIHIDPESHLSEVDQRIVQLNHEGLSLKQTSEQLLERFGIQLGKSSVQRHLEELRQDPDNDIQENFETTAPRRSKDSRWYKVIERLKTNLEEYSKKFGFKASSRTMYYQLIDDGLMKGSESEHKTFGDYAKKARLGWTYPDGELMFPELDIDCFASDESRLSSTLRQDWIQPREPTDPFPIEDPESYIDDYIERIKRAITFYSGVGLHGEHGRIGHRWYNQDEYVEVWQEKADLHPAFESILRPLEVNVKSGKGYPSLTFLNECATELKERIEKYGIDPKSIHILYCGDLDPSGENITWYIRKRLKQLGIEDIDFRMIAITEQQIDEYHFPLLDIEKKPDKQAPNPNLADFVRRRGYKATHLNAFFTKDHFDTFKDILTNIINKEYWDEDIYQEMIDEYDIEADPPDELDDIELERRRDLMAKRVTKAFKRGWYDDDEDG